MIVLYLLNFGTVDHNLSAMAGNIIPAIASTNAIVAGLIVTTAFNVLLEHYHKCDTVK